jgi:N-acetylglucosamine kinase-like BadF-type ATPase
MARLYLGVDGGGTNTRALAADGRGRIFGSGRSGSTNRNHYPRDEVRSNLRHALLEAAGSKPIDDAVIFLGMCGVSTDADRADIISVAREITEIDPRVQIVVENDARIALTGGLSGRPGIVLIAGTGSACFGINGEGKTYWCGGWGALADDAGSGPWVGMRAIQAAVRAEDARLDPTSLRDLVFQFLELREPRELIDRVHNRGLSREELGMLAPPVIAAAQQGDRVAVRIVRDATAELSLLVSTTASKLFGGKSCELILTGGLALSGPPFQTLLIDRIRQDMPTIQVRDPEMSPVQGAVLEAFARNGIAWTGAILDEVRRGIP